MLVGEIGNAKATAEIQSVQTASHVVRNAQGDLDSLSILRGQNCGLQNLCASENMDATKFQVRALHHSIQNLDQDFLINSKRRGSPAHSHSAAFRLAARIDAYSNPSPGPQFCREP